SCAGSSHRAKRTKVAERFDHILNDCVDRLLRGETVEQCLQHYPEQAEQLEPLLRTAAAAHAASASVEPRPEFKAQVRYQALAALQAGKGKRRRNRMPVLGWLPRWG
ncbi:MAG: hypothetical protein NTU41_10850, partial [Chloroflexi bacterium]|nr:hypothetical protein [Chloroflexota bacterium]